MELQSLSSEMEKEEQEALIRHHEAEELLKKLTLEEKVGLLSGATMWESGGVPRLNLPRLFFSDGPHGARGAGLHGNRGAALAPCLSALAATFNEEIIRKVGEILGQECAARGANVLLGPCVNIHRSPITGRHFECFSEDPYLTSRCAVSYVRGVQRFSAACVKHFAGNDQEADRGHSNSVISERVLHEVYLQPFEACVRAGVQTIMTGYNRLNGEYCTENRQLLQETLRDSWQFKGLVVSDWWGNRTTKALEAGLNVEMPGIEPRYFGGYLMEQVRDGRVSQELLDERCRPVLRTMLRYPRKGGVKAPEMSKRKAVFTEAALQSLVLLKNSGALPLKPMKRLAVIGPKASSTTLQGGGSSRVHADRSPSILDALESALEGSGVQLLHEPGCSSGERPVGSGEVEGLKRMGACDANGQPISFHFEAHLLDLVLHMGAWCSQKEFFRRRVMPCLRPLGLRHRDPEEVHKGTVSIELNHDDTRASARRGTTMLWGLLLGGLVGAGAAGACAATGGAAAVSATLVATGGALGVIGAEGMRQHHRHRQGQVVENENQSISRAEALAADCDVTVLVLGTDGFWECEGVDQPHMQLPGRQDELASKCAAAAKAAGKKVVVVLNVGSPKELPWLEEVDAVLLSYYGGECTAVPIAQCLLGANGANPSGRVPSSWPRCLAEASSEVARTGIVNRSGDVEQLGYRNNVMDPVFDGLSYTTFEQSELQVDASEVPRMGKVNQPGDVEYHEGLHLGYRNGELEPMFHFGHGLSYTSFEHSNLHVDVDAKGSVTATVTLEVKNLGPVAGAEVVQVYVTTLQVPRALRAFARTKVLQVQESCKVSFQLDERALGSLYDPHKGGWVRPSQDPEILLEVGASSKDVRLSRKLMM